MRAMNTYWRTPVLAVVLAVAFTATADAEIRPEVMQQAYARMAPALCRLVYTSEVFNTGTGETARRGNNALGLIVSPEGLVMTHGHMVLENSTPVNVVAVVGVGDGEREIPARVLPKPDDVNIVFLQLESPTPLSLPYVRFSEQDRLELGEPIFTVGLLGEPLDYARSISEARIGSILERPRRTYCLADAVRFGMVGGPAINSRGEAVGVIGFDLAAAEGGDVHTRSGHPLVYQASLFRDYLRQPPSGSIEEGGPNEAWLGVFTQPLTDDFAEYWKIAPTGGLIVSTVVPGSPAAVAGLQAGDVIKWFDGTRITAKLDREVVQFTQLVRSAGPGKTVTVGILRDGEPQDVSVALLERPRTARDAVEFEEETFGLTVRELTTDVRIALNLPEEVQGVIVRSVRSGSTAQLGRIRPGVVILGFGGHPVASVEEFQDALNKVLADKPDEVAVFARVGSSTGFFRLEPRWAE